MEKIIHFTVPEQLSPIQVQAVERARALHPTWEIKVWQDPVRPDGYLLEKYWSKVNSGAQLSDLLRIDILYKWGGVYVDGDLWLVKPLDELANRFNFFAASENGISLEGALIGARKSHPAIKKLINEILLNEPDWSLSPHQTTGPDLFARTLRWDKSITVLPRETFYCYAAETNSKRIHRHSYGEHLWAYSWKELDQIGKPKNWKLAKKLGSAANRIAKPVINAGFQAWHQLKPTERAPPRSRFYPICDELLVNTTHGFNIIVDGNDLNLTPEVVFGSSYQSREEYFYKQILKGGDWAIDVGSSVAPFCMLAAQLVGSFGRVFAYEQNPKAMKLLSKSLIMNWMHDCVRVRSAVAGEIAGSLTAGRAKVREGESCKVNDSEKDQCIGAVETGNSTDAVPCVTLDKEFPIDLPIKSLRIDAEGQETAVLKGARRLLEHRCIDFVLIRMFQEGGRSPWRNKVKRSRLSELVAHMNSLTESNYIACTLASDGSLNEHKSLTEAMDKLEGRSVVLMARQQYSQRF